VIFALDLKIKYLDHINKKKFDSLSNQIRIKIIEETFSSEKIEITSLREKNNYFNINISQLALIKIQY